MSFEELDIENKVREIVYKKMCSCCPYAKQCHDECEECDEFNEELEKELEKWNKTILR